VGIQWNDISKNSNGGTEMMLRELEKRVSPDLLGEFQIIPSRLQGELDPTKIRLLWLHDLPSDPESDKLLLNNGWQRFHRLVCVSHWQMNAYHQYYKIPLGKFVVLQNAIEPIPAHEKPTDKIRLVYTSTPHRGLNILSAVFKKLSTEHENLELNVFSSFKLYGWPEENDKPFEALFDDLRGQDNVVYHGSQPNEVVRETLQQSHIFAYPSIWQETSCLCLLEAMSAGLICVHPNYAALPETAGHWNMMYQWHEDINIHATMFYQVLTQAILMARNDSDANRRHRDSMRSYTNGFYNWELRKNQWEAFLGGVVGEPREIPEINTGGMFSYET
jgi:UDP-glucose:(glucosyl)LPS alpha-1,2-glucosyltransferase